MSAGFARTSVIRVSKDAVFRALIVALLLGPLTAGLGTARENPSDASGAGAITPLLDRVLSAPRWFTGSDGQIHLVHELVLTNPISLPVTVTSVEVMDVDSGDVLLNLSGKHLLAAMSLAATPNEPDVTLAPSAIGVVWIDVVLDDVNDLPTSVAHRITVELPPGSAVDSSLLSYTGSEVAVDRRPPVVLGAPLEGPQWAALGSCCDGPHRRALLPIDGAWFLAQRFAIDFNLLEADNRPGVGDPSLFTSFSTYGAPVLAVADATVVEAVYRYPDLNVGEGREAITAESAGGNRIVLDLGDGRFAVYAHLQAGSIEVEPGDLVSRGQRIAGVGSSGTSGGPHLHFQVNDRPSVVIADGLPFVFDTFEVSGRTPPLLDVLPYYDTLEPIPIDTDSAGPRRDSMPLGRDVVTFPGSGQVSQSTSRGTGAIEPTRSWPSTLPSCSRDIAGSLERDANRHLDRRNMQCQRCSYARR